MTRPKRPTFRIYEARQINHTSINTTDIYIYTKQSDQLKPTFNPDSINQISQTAPNHSRQSNLRDQTTTSLLCWKNPHSLSKMERKPWPRNQTDKSDWIKVDSMTFDLDSSIIYVQVETQSSGQHIGLSPTEKLAVQLPTRTKQYFKICPLCQQKTLQKSIQNISSSTVTC